MKSWKLLKYLTLILIAIVSTGCFSADSYRFEVKKRDDGVYYCSFLVENIGSRHITQEGYRKDFNQFINDFVTGNVFENLIKGGSPQSTFKYKKVWIFDGKVYYNLVVLCPNLKSVEKLFTSLGAQANRDETGGVYIEMHSPRKIIKTNGWVNKISDRIKTVSWLPSKDFFIKYRNEGERVNKSFSEDFFRKFGPSKTIRY